MRSIVNILLTALVVIVIAFGGSVGCFGGLRGCAVEKTPEVYEMCFNEQEIGLFVGDTKTFTTDDFTFSPQAPGSFSFTLSSSDTEVLSINGTSVTAKREGESELTVTTADGVTAACTVTVSKELNEFELVARTKSRLIYDDREIIVYAVVNGTSESGINRNIEWAVDGVQQAYTGSVYTVGPRSTDTKVTVSAKLVGGGETLSDDIILSWYSGYENTPTFTCVSGKIEQTEGSVVTYSASAEGDANVYEWFVNGNAVENDDATFEFKPLVPGSYDITCKVNGVTAVCDDGKSKVMLNGSVVPSALTVDYDTFYPSTCVSWKSATEDEKFLVSVTDENGIEKAYEADGNSIMLTAAQLDIFASGYSVKVKSLGDGAALSESDYCTAFSLSKFAADIKPFFEKTYFGGNYYLTSDEEFCEIYDYFMLYRKQPTSGKTTFKGVVYMGYESAYLLDRLSEIAFNRAGYTGSYLVDAKRDGNLVTLDIEFETVSVPTGGSQKASSAALNGIRPHISEAGRDETHAFAIDKIQKTAEVHTTDQLYRVIEMGYKPIIKSDDVKAYYDYARGVLNGILDEDMSAVDKAHAIYDWVMWRTLYDNTATLNTDISVAVKDKAFYVEGVLNGSNPYAVCDGMSKAYSLLCNMEGIPCVRVTGSAENAGTYGGHAWNKVRVDGEWFIVDCTWGDTAIAVSEGKRVGLGMIKETAAYELASHFYFLKTDGEMSTHIEDADTAYPKTSPIPYNAYAELDYSVGEGKLRSYAYSTESLTEYAQTLAQLAAETLGETGYNTFSVTGEQIKSPYFAFEIYLADSNYDALKAVLGKSKSEGNPIPAALEQKGLSYNMFLNGNRVIIVASKLKALMS